MTSLIILPLEGSPYILDGKKDLATLQKIVGGSIESACPAYMDINPYGSKEWFVAKILLCVAKQVWANENGMSECSPNMLTINKQNGIPMFGRLAIEVEDKHITDAVRKYLKIKKLG